MYFPPYSLLLCDNQINFCFSVLQCIKKNGASLEHLELSRSSLLRMDPLRFRNVVSAASRLSTLVVRNICSDAMLKLIGANCNSLQVLVVANSKQVSYLASSLEVSDAMNGCKCISNVSLGTS